MSAEDLHVATDDGEQSWIVVGDDGEFFGRFATSAEAQTWIDSQDFDSPDWKQGRQGDDHE